MNFENIRQEQVYKWEPLTNQQVFTPQNKEKEVEDGLEDCHSKIDAQILSVDNEKVPFLSFQKKKMFSIKRPVS